MGSVSSADMKWQDLLNLNSVDISLVLGRMNLSLWTKLQVLQRENKWCLSHSTFFHYVLVTGTFFIELRSSIVEYLII
jgi:hypothetical protein